MNTSADRLPTQPPLAVVGLSALFPKAANTEEFWSNIRRGVDAITEVPSTHWNPDDYFDENQKTPDMTYARRGGFLSPLPFDPLEFGISPNNLEAIDTSQLLGMVGAKRALEHAGYGAGRQFDRSRVGCILGVTGTLEMVIPLGARLGHPRWRKALKDAGVADDVADDVVNRISQSYVSWQENSFPGLLGNVVAGRIANRLDLHGTNCVVDAACASSLSAIHLAALELWTGRSDMIVTGGIDTFNDIFMFMCFSKTPALSASGDSKPFSDEADGTILGEGVGIVVLKRLADAERDGDRIYAVLKGIGTSSDGAGNAVYAPKAEGQIRCLQDAYRVSGVSPDTVELVEAHGTGTKVGDATEVTALMQVYQSTGRRGPWCAVGSVKSQIGHTKAAAGAAGIIKAILALQHRVLPPTIKVNQPPAPLLADESPFYVNTTARPWLKPSGYPRRAAVSAFGFGGSNFHCVLEESPQSLDQPSWDGDVQAIPVSAATIEELSQTIRSLLSTPTPDWAPIRATSAAMRSSFRANQPQRVVLVVERDKTDINKLVTSVLTMLERYPEKSAWSTPDGAYYGRGPSAGKLGILFPGQGSQYVGMLRDLTCQFPAMNNILAEANDVFTTKSQTNGHSSSRNRLSDYIFPHPAFSSEASARHDAELRATQVAQPAIGAISLAVLSVLDHFGIQPEAVAGHSYGELTALCASRRFAPQVLYRLSMLRGQLMAAAQEVEGGMLAVGAPLTQIEAALKELSVDLVVANHNSPTQVVLSGRIPEIDRATTLLASRNIRGKKLSVAAAFHSPLVAPASRAFRPVLDDVDFVPSSMPVYANSTAAQYPADSRAAKDLLATQLARPVHFVQEVEQMYADGVRTFVEVGPGAVLTGLVNSILSGRDIRAMAVDSSSGKRSGLVDLATVLAQLAAAGHNVTWNQWDPRASTEAAATDPKRLRIPISGANYVKPRPPIPPRISQAAEEAKVELVLGSTLTSDPALPLSERAPVPKFEIASEVVAPKPPVTPKETPISMKTSPVSNNPPNVAVTSTGRVDADRLETIRETLEALQRLQSETSRLHQQFLEGQEAALQTLARLARQYPSDLVGAPKPGSEAQGSPKTALPPRTVPVFAQPVQSIQVPLAPVAVVQPAAQPPRPLPPPPLHAVEASAVAPVTVPVLPLPPVASSTAPASPSSISSATPSPIELPAMTSTPSALASIVLSVVSEKTGYPTEMLNLDMSLDHDLGIDSIKRVEILSALQERVPHLPAFQPDELVSLHTLRDVVVLADGRTPSAQIAPSLPLIRPTAMPGPETERGDSASATSHGSNTSTIASSRLGPIVLEVVSEKTGYPTEMLNLEMSLDHDLGIDSIKRVEILSALQERVADLPAFQPEELGALHTLRDVVSLADQRSQHSLSKDILAAETRAASVTSPIATPDSENKANSTATAPVSTSTAASLGSTVLAVVSEKTGYPVEMLNLEMSLDHDLGIDSIKRVEILSALQERVPQLPAFQPEELGALHTLRDVVTLADQRSRATSAPVATSPLTTSSAAPTQSGISRSTNPAEIEAQSSSSSTPLGPVVLDVVAEKTGYPVEMLNLEMSLDHDLGIDSIKRVEILSALQERVPHLPAFQPEELGALHTLSDVVTLADQRSSGSRSSKASQLSATVAALPQQGAAAEQSASPPTQADHAATSLSKTVLQVVSEKTGYPVEMLNVEMSLDHDLGIDSIKRVEILSALQERVPNLPAFQPDELGALHTLHDVVALADDRTGRGSTTSALQPGASANHVSAPVATRDIHPETTPSPSASPNTVRLAVNLSPIDPRVKRSIVHAVPLAPFSTRTAITLAPGSEIWITEDGLDLSLKIADELRDRGFRPRVVNLEEQPNHAVPDSLAGLIIVAPQAGTGSQHLWRAIEWLQKVGPSLRKANARSTLVATVSRLDGRFGFDGTRRLQDPLSGGLAGIAKCVAREWPTVIARAFDLANEWSAPHVAAAMLVTELLHEGPIETGLTSAGSFQLETREESLSGHSLMAPISSGDVIVVSGGARGVTAEAAVALANAWRPTLVILGRSPEPAAEPDWLSSLGTEADIRRALIARAPAGTLPKSIANQLQQIVAGREIAQQLQRLRSTGIAVEYHSVDVRDPVTMAPILAEVRRRLGPVRGVIHGAGVLADHRIEDKTREQFDRVYQTKIGGLKSLLDSIDTSQLRVLGLFSSYTARFGRVGQLDYAIANEVLNKQARQFAQTHPQCHVASFNWGPWDGGMVQGGLKQLFAAEGVGLIPLVGGAQLLVREFSQSASQPTEILVLADSDSSQAVITAAASPLFQRAVNEIPMAVLSPTSPIANPSHENRQSTTNGQGTAHNLNPPAKDSDQDFKAVFERTLSVSDHSFLSSHVLGGKAVLPVAIILEWLAHGAIHRNAGLELHGFDDLRIYQGVRLGINDRLPLKVLSGKPLREHDSFKVPMRLTGEMQGRQVIHAAGTAVLGNAHSLNGAPSIRITTRPYPRDLANAYRERLFHGPRFMGISAIEGCSGEGIIVTSRLAPAAAEWMHEPARGNWLADPLAIDAALQAIILWSQELLGKPCLPCAVKKYRQFRRTFPRDQIRIAVRVHPAADQLIRCDVEFVDSHGQLVARMEGCESVADASLSSAFQKNQIDV